MLENLKVRVELNYEMNMWMEIKGGGQEYMRLSILLKDKSMP